MATPSFVRRKNTNSAPVKRNVTTMTAISSSPSTSPPEASVHPGDRALERERVVAPDRPGDEAQHEAERDGQNHHRELRLAEHAAKDRALEEPADRGHDDDCPDAGDPERQAEMRFVGEAERGERAEHHHVAPARS